MKRRILIVEDESHIADALQLNLELAGYQVHRAEDGASGYDLARKGVADLVVLDIMLPEMDGLTVCKKLRKEGNHIPILFLTAKDRDEDKIKGLETGGDDYLTKPFAIEELLARIRGMFRRQEWYQRPGGGTDEFTFADVHIDFRTFQARVRGETRRLTEREAMLMKLFAERAGEVVDRFAILDRVWGYDAYPSTRAVDNLVLRVRKLFEEDPARPRHIHSIYGVGYRFTPDPEEHESE